MSPLCSPSTDGPGSDRWDRLGVWASIACTAHCMAAPLLFILAPGFAGIWAHPGSHALIATLVLPLAVTVIHKGYKLHGRRWIAGATGLGMSLILAGCVLPFIGEAESSAGTCTDCCPRLVETQAGGWDLQMNPASIVSILGSLFLIAAHIGNMTCRRKCCETPSRGN